MNQLVVTSPDDLQRIITDAVNAAIAGRTEPQSEQPEVFTNRQAMQYLNVSRSTLQRWRNEGKLPYRQIQGKILYTRADIDQLLNESLR